MTASHDPAKTKGAAPNQENAPFASDGLKHTGNSNSAQCARLLQRPRQGPLTTTEAQRKLDVYDPPARVFQLRAQGHRIDTVWTRDETEAGVLHRVGRYVLVKEAA